MGAPDSANDRSKFEDNAQKLANAVSWDDAVTAQQLLLDAGDACHVKALAREAHGLGQDWTVGLELGVSGDKETIGLYRRSSGGEHFDGRVAWVELPICNDTQKMEK